MALREIKDFLSRHPRRRGRHHPLEAVERRRPEVPGLRRRPIHHLRANQRGIRKTGPKPCFNS